MALTPEQIDRLIQQADGLAPKEGSIFRALVKLTEAEVRKQDDALIRQLEEALTDIVEAGEEAWGKDRPCVRIGKEAINASRARLGEKT